MRYFVFVLFLTSLAAEQVDVNMSEQIIPRLLVDKKVQTEDSQKILPRLLQEPKKEIQEKVPSSESQVTEKIKVLDRVEISKGDVIDSEVVEPEDVTQVVEAPQIEIKESEVINQVDVKKLQEPKIEKPQVLKREKVVLREPAVVLKPQKHDIETIESVQSARSYRNHFKTYEKDLTRQQMLRQAKYLKQKYMHAMTKLETWEMEKEQKKKDFFRRYSHEDTSFGADNSYGKKRADRRKREFFKSLAIQEKHIQDRVEDSIAKLSDIKAEFLYKFAVPLTEAEMNGGTPPAIENRTKRVEMLQEYINENSAWQQCRQKVSEFDRVNRVANSIETLFPEVNLTSQAITTKMEQNKQEMNSHASRFNTIERDYRSEYGVSISNTQRAKMILESITH